MSEQPERWSEATVYPDMWSGPDADPRNSEGVSPDGELATLQDYLHHAHICQTSGDSVRLSQALTGQGVSPLS